MANPTTNFGWVMPTSSSLVTNLPADFNTFGQAVDTSMAQLKGGTTGQILSKTSATDMAFTWITNDVGDITAVTAGTGISGGGTSGAVTVTNSMATAITTAGDLIKGTGSGTFDRLGIGSTGQVLTVTAGAPAWATPAAGTPTFRGVRLEKTAAQSIANATYTAITYTGETYDTSSYHDNSSNTSRITIPAGLGGYYLIAYQISWSTSGNGQRLVRVYVNGSTIPYMNGFANPSGGYDNNFAGATILNLSAGDYIELFGYQDSGGALNCNGNNSNGGLGRFEATLLGV